VQLTNVKIMVFCLTAITTYMLPYHQDFPHILIFGLVLPFTGPVCILAWLFAGVLLQGIFRKHHRIFYTLMGLSLLYCAIGIVW
jgi:cysteine/O-acetylserine efflux protein